MDDAKAMASRPPHSEEDAKLQAKLFDLQQENKQQETQRGAFDRVSPATPLVPPTPGAGRWRSMLFGCGSDLPICCAVCCCHWVTTGQLYERAVRKRMLTRLPLLSCASIAMFIFGMDLYHQTMRSLFSSGTYLWINQAGAEGQLVNIFDPSAWVNATLDPKVDDEPGIEHSAAVMLLYIGELCAALASLCACAIVCTVRAALRRRENIASQCCGSAEDCFCACCCNPCTQCMLLRHEKESLATPAPYALCLDTAFPV